MSNSLAGSHGAQKRASAPYSHTRYFTDTLDTSCPSNSLIDKDVRNRNQAGHRDMVPMLLWQSGLGENSLQWVVIMNVVDGGIILHLYHYQLKDGLTLVCVGKSEDMDMDGH